MGHSQSGDSEVQRLQARVLELEQEVSSLRGQPKPTRPPIVSDVAPRRRQAPQSGLAQRPPEQLNDERLWQILESLPIIIAIHERDMTVRYVNRAGSEEDVPMRVGESPLAWVTERDKDRCSRAFSTLFLAGDADPFEVSDKNGSVWSVRLASLVDHEGRRRALSCTVDVTQHKQLEQQVRQAQKVESLGTLAGTIAHDFNNLLVAMLGNVDLGMRWYEEGRDPSGCFDNIREAAQRAAALCRQMLAYSGRERATLTAIDLNETVRRMSQLMRAAISARIDLNIDLSPSLPRIQADDSQVGQVVLNLLTNAAEAIGHGYGRVSVRTARVVVEEPQLDYLPAAPPIGSHVMLEVSDDGPGMDARTRSMVFDPFFTSKEGGHGLGLSAVLGIVRSHGGAVRVASTPGEGTTFTVLFPVMEQQPRIYPTDSKPAPGAKGFGTVLVVDDEHVVRDLASAVLREAGYFVVEAVDGDAALAALDEYGTRLRAVVLDLTMPRRDGLSTLAEIRKRYASLPVVLSSGRPYAAEVTDSDPMIRWLGKPYSIGELLSTVTEAADLAGEQHTP